MAEVISISRAHKIRLAPNRAQEEYLRRACGVRRFAFNWALAEWNRQYALHKDDPAGNPRPGWAALARQFNGIKDAEYPWIREVSCRVPDRAIRDVDAAWKNFFRSCKNKDMRFKPPRFAKKGRHERFYVHQSELAFKGKHVRIGMVRKVGWIRAREEIRFDGKIQGATVTRVADQWYLSVQVVMEHGVTAHPTGESVGIDMGVANQVAMSTGQLLNLPIKEMRELEQRIRRANKTLARRWSGKIKKGHADKALRDSEGNQLHASNRFRKQADRLAKMHRR
ncbi:MAG: transposase, partial [Rhodopirellula sp.]|nr:transposase [Rhodopirellula sp.]